MHEALARRGVELHLNAGPGAVLGKRGRVRALGMTDGREIPAGAVLFATGVTPNLEFLEGAGLTGPDGLTVDAHLQTVDPHIYAAGAATGAGSTGRAAWWASPSWGNSRTPASISSSWPSNCRCRSR
ncbi:MAG: FAD-dependent oxidoreductase [Pseudomonadota bacterium]